MDVWIDKNGTLCERKRIIIHLSSCVWGFYQVDQLWRSQCHILAIILLTYVKYFHDISDSIS